MSTDAQGGARAELHAALLTAIGEHESLLARFRAESDRGAILVAASFLDATLEKVLRSAMVHWKRLDALFNFEGPVGAFSARINLAFALGLIHENTRDHLHRVRRIRNDCAHSPETVDFETNSVRDLVDGMWPVDNFIPDEMKDDRRKLVRARFLVNAAILYAQLQLVLRHGAKPREQLWMSTHLRIEGIQSRIATLETQLEQSRREIDAERADIERSHEEIAAGLAGYAAENGISVEEARARVDALVDAQLAPSGES